NNSPILTVDAKILAKRIQVGRHNGGGHHHSTTTYFVTFEVEGGGRVELKVPGREYGLLVEGDLGELTSQGTRFKSFERLIKK
ncbi:MAG: DUF2500 domain-containing protein, partial [Clostridiales bacterium]|nr:DUF2500 domain-containing protein [Clostridiales bacterium]